VTFGLGRQNCSFDGAVRSRDGDVAGAKSLSFAAKMHFLKQATRDLKYARLPKTVGQAPRFSIPFPQKLVWRNHSQHLLHSSVNSSGAGSLVHLDLVLTQHVSYFLNCYHY
jgi:hypothetical protein